MMRDDYLTTAEAWLPPYVPDDVQSWTMTVGDRPHSYVYVRGTQAYQFRCRADGRAVEILAYQDGFLTYHWRRDPIEGTWPGTYAWKAIAISGGGLAR